MVDLLGSLPIQQTALPDMPLPLVVALALIQNGILLAAAVAIGLVLSERIGLRMPRSASALTHCIACARGSRAAQRHAFDWHTRLEH